MDTREKLIELLQDSVYENVELDDGYVGFDVNYDNIANHLIANGVTVNEWISVKGRLPEEDGYYLCFTGLTYRILGFAKDGNKVSKYDLRNMKNIWYAYDSEYGYYRWEDVNHWMPLPEAPKGE